MKQIKRFEVYWVTLDPTIGSEIKKTRPGVVVSPDELNEKLAHVIIVPVTSATRDVPFRYNIVLAKEESQCACEHIRTVDKSRLGKKIKTLSLKESKEVSKILQIMFVF